MVVMDEQKMLIEYERSVGKPPNNRFFDDPDWAYRGTKAEREALQRRLEIWEEDEPVVIEGQEALFE